MVAGGHESQMSANLFKHTTNSRFWRTIIRTINWTKGFIGFYNWTLIFIINLEDLETLLLCKFFYDELLDLTEYNDIGINKKW